MIVETATPRSAASTPPAGAWILAEPRADPRQRLGRLGESAAAAALARQGLRIVERRFRLRSGEIDLVAERGDLVVFAEVKTRRGARYGTPAEAVTPLKERRIARAALIWLARNGRLDRRVRFDVVEVWAEGERVRRVRHIPDAFRPDREP